MNPPTTPPKTDTIELIFADYDCNNITVMEAMDRADALINQATKEARIDSVQELKRRWHEDRKTMDYSPATYTFICEKYLAELKEEQ